LPIYAENDGDKGLPRGILIKILIFVTLIGMSAVVMRPLQTALHLGMKHIRSNLIEKTENFTGLKIHYSSIRPTIFGSFDIRNLKLFKDDDVILSVSRARISFSFSELLLRKKMAVHSIQIDRAVLNIDTQRDEHLIQLLASAPQENEKKKDTEIIQKIADFFPEKPDFKIRDCSLKIVDGGSDYHIQNMNLDIGGNKNELSLNGKFTAELNNSGLFKNSYSLKTEIAIDGICSSDMEKGSAGIVFSSFAISQQEEKKGNFFFKPLSASTANAAPSALFNTQPLTVSLDFKDRLLSLQTSGEASRYNASFEFNTDTRRMSVAMDCDNFQFSDIVRFTDNRRNANHLLSLPVTGKASFTHEKNSGLMHYNVNFKSAASSASSDSFAVRVNGSEKSVSFDEFWLNASPNSAKAGLFQGKFSLTGKMGIDTLTPWGTIVFDRFSLTGDGYINSVFKVSSTRKEIAITSEKAVIGSCVLNDVDIFLFPSERDIGVLAYAQREDKGRVSMEATLNYNPRQFDASLSLGSFSALDLVEMFRPFSNSAKIPPVADFYLKDTELNAEIFFTTDFNHFVYNATNILIKAGGIEGSLSFSGTDRQFSLSEGIFIVDENDLLLSAQVNFSNPMDLIFTANASYLDFSWHMDGQILDRTTLIIRDPNGLHAYGNVSNTGAISGYLEGVSFPIPIKSKPVYLNFYITLRYTSKDFWSVDVAHFEAVDYSSPNKNETLRISGAADQDGASFRDLVYNNKIDILAGSADFSWDRKFSYIQFIVNLTDGKEEGEFYYIDGMLKDKHFKANASVSKMRIDRFLKGNQPVLLNGNASVAWDSVDSFNAQLNLTSLYAKLNEYSFQASAAVIFTNNNFTVSDLKIDYAQINAVLPSLEINRADGFAKANADLKGYILENRIESKIELSANFMKMDSWVQIKEALDSIDGLVAVEKIFYKDKLHEPFNVLFANNDTGLWVSGGPGDMLRIEMDRSGDFFAGLSSPSPIQASVAGSFNEGNIDAHCGDFFIDLEALWSLVPHSPEFEFLGGYITAKMDIRGPIINPEFFGSGKGSSFRMKVPSYISSEIKPIPFNVVLDGSEMSFGPVPAMVGKGEGFITGLFIFEKWVPDNFNLDIKIPAQSPIPYSLNITGFLAKGDTSGDISLVLDNTTLDINGSLVAHNTEMGLSVDEIMQKHPGNEAVYEKVSVIVNLTITTGSAVEFVWPNSSLPILRANPEMGTVIAVTADSLTGQFSLNTDVKIRSGELNYFDRNFYIRQGNLVFKENENQFSPRITARAEIRDRTDTGPVTISMIIDNEPLLNFVPRFEANPVLTQFEIYSLLGQNVYYTAGSNDSIDAAQLLLTSTADILGQFFGVRLFERQVRNFLHLDMFSVRTKILQNAVSSAAISGFGTSPVDRNSRVGNYFDNTTVFVGKYVGQDMFVQGMLSVKYDENKQSYGGLKLEPDIGIELQSPLFNIRWDFFPYNPQNWWVNDNSITLTWSKSF